jgi:hypothetical protein
MHEAEPRDFRLGFDGKAKPFRTSGGIAGSEALKRCFTSVARDLTVASVSSLAVLYNYTRTQCTAFVYFELLERSNSNLPMSRL